MRRLATIAMMFALLSASALAQEPGRRTSRTDEQKRQDADIDQAYRNVIRNTGDKSRAAPAQDPWGLVRPSSGKPGERR